MAGVALCLSRPVAFGATTPDPGLAGQELESGARDEGRGAFPSALAHYRACVAAAPASRAARAARGRIGWIEERSEGGFAPLATLVRLRGAPETLGDPVGLGRLTAEAETFPAGLVRSEVRLRLAEAWRKLGAHRAEAEAELQRIVADPSSGGADRRSAERDLVEGLLADGHLDAAREEIEAHPFDPGSAAEVGRRLHRRRVRRLAVGGLLALLALGAGAAFSARRRPDRWLPAGPASPPAS